MNCTQNHKIDQVSDQTLIVGIVGMDIAKRKHYVCFVNVRGRILKKSFPVIQSRHGFEQPYQRILEAMSEFGKTEVIVAIEPAEHDWLNLAYFLE